MSKAQATPETTESNVVVSAENRKFRGIAWRPDWKKALAAILVVVVVAGGILFIEHRHHVQQQQIAAQKRIQAASARAQQQQTPLQAAETAANNGQYATGQQILDGAIAQTSDPKQQASLYLDKSTLALQAKKYDDALTFAQSAESLDPTADSASLIALTAQAQGNKQLAITYYQKEIQRIKTPNDGYTIPSIQQQIKSLGG